MNVSAGLLKLERLIKARQSLLIKIENDPENQMIINTIAQHTKDIDYIKNAINFDARFEVNSPSKKCKCDKEKCLDLPKKGDSLELGEVQGVYVKVKLLKKDGTIGNQIQYFNIEELSK